MITEELLQFIREQRATGMNENEITRLLISEGGWDQSDVDEALGALAALSATSRPVQPEESPKEMALLPATPAPLVATPPVASPILPDNQPTSAPLPSPAEPSSLAPVEKTSSVRLNLDKILPSVQGGQLLSQIKAAHPETSKLFEKSVPAPSELTKPKEEPAPIPVVAPVVTPTESPKVAPPVASIPPAEAKTLTRSLEGVFSGSNVAANTPPPSGPPNTPVPTRITPLKFNLASLHASAPLSTKEESGSSPVVHEPMALHPSPIISPAPALVAKVKEKVESAPVMPMDSASGGKEKKNSAIPSTRTMASDLLSQQVSPSSVHEGLPFSGALKTNEGEEKGLTTSPAPSVSAVTIAPFEDDATHRAKIKRMLEIAFGVVLALLLICGGVFAYLKFRTPDPSLLLSTASNQFFALSSFSYKGQATTDIALSAVAGGTVQNGTMKFSLGYNGAIANGQNGYGDGTHNVSLSGGWNWGGALLSTDITADVRVVGSALYIHVLSFPAKSNLDPQLFQDNWIKIDFSEIAQELSVSGVGPGSEEYGTIGGTSSGTSFNTLLAKSAPFRTTGTPKGETVGGVPVTHIQVVAEPVSMATFIQSLYRKYFNRDLTLSPDELVRLQGALAKVTGDVWIDAHTGALSKIILNANFDDDIVGVHVTGPMMIELNLVDFNKPVAVDVPTAVLSLAELKVKMDEYQKLQEIRARDQVKIDRVLLLQSALENYRQRTNRYPKVLTELYTGGELATSSLPLLSLTDYYYRSYLSATNFARAAQCSTTGKVCAFYHLGTNLEDPTNPVLQSDVDQTTAIFGTDSTGCAGEPKLACYDVVSPALSASTTATSTPK